VTGEQMRDIVRRVRKAHRRAAREQENEGQEEVPAGTGSDTPRSKSQETRAEKGGSPARRRAVQG
jgi:hypothetical protein